jgi:hypothetical protein
MSAVNEYTDDIVNKSARTTYTADIVNKSARATAHIVFELKF